MTALPTPLRLAWLEWRAVGWLGTLALLVGAALATVGLQHVPPSYAGFTLGVVVAAALALALALLPSPGTDSAWEITAGSAEPEGRRQLRQLACLVVLALLALAVLTPVYAPGRPIPQVWTWFAPRAAWFAAPALLVLWRTGNPALAGGAVAGIFVVKYCPIPFEWNMTVFFEPRLTLHALGAGMVLLAFGVPWTWLRVSWALRLGTGLLAAALVFAPAVPALTPQRIQAVTPAGLTSGYTVLQAPWASLHEPQMSAVLKLAESSGQALRVLTAFPEQGEPDGTALARQLGVKRFPVLLRVEDGRVSSVDWTF
ncbi:hypothetical protein [Deinococcus koreensis]|uniref:Uncharacterized protein n=1 Tax=Deinococcus koreensis TaxID=2054903 RepID=A0A2K3UZI0_9DEIO|nr:hypothetical protein [Deinococcus koreensis]PNY81933.1 hypothetical protein CVO96_11640 [Deinococcus koreensis]